MKSQYSFVEICEVLFLVCVILFIAGFWVQ